VGSTIVGWLLVSATNLPAATLIHQLGDFFDHTAFPANGHTYSQLITPVIERIALSGIDLPVTATSPSYSYRFESGLAAERLPGSLGPLFTERVETVGRNKVEAGVAYQYADLTRFDGEPFADRIDLKGSLPFGPGTVTQAFRADHFSLKVQTISLFLTYGITDAWDVNLLQPLIGTSLEVGGNERAVFNSPGLSPGTSAAHVDTEGSRFGIGDTFLRTKYRFATSPILSFAALLSLRFPSGNPGNFQGTGDVHVAPALVMSRKFGLSDFHATLGWDLDASDVQRSRATYAIGTSIYACERVTLLLDLLGTSGVTADDVTTPAGRFPERYGFDDFLVSKTPTEVTAAIPRTDILNIAPGIKVALGSRFVAAFSPVIPITTDGLRPRFILTGYLEAYF
jgi:hypothetical protein